MKDLRVGLFVDGFIPAMDGVTITVRNYAYWLNRTLGPTYVVTPLVPKHVDVEDYPVIRFLSIPTFVRPPYRIGLPGIDVKLRRSLGKRDFALVHAHSPFGAGAVALKTARKKGIPLVATFHTKYREDLVQAIKLRGIVDQAIRRIVDFYESADSVWVPGQSVANTLLEYGYKGSYQVVENGIDIKPPTDIAPFRVRGAQHLKLPEGIPVGLFVGQHIWQKNIELILRSLPSVMEAVPEFRMVFVGQGHAKSEIIDLARSLGLGERVIFHDVVYDRELLMSIYARADVFLFPSLYDNAPLVIREAAAFGTPSVMIQGATAAEVIRDGENGFLAENRPEAYASRVIEALGDSSLLAKVSAGARSSLCRTWEDVVAEVRTRYLSLLGKTGVE